MSQPAALGLRACKGGAVAICLALQHGAPQVLFSSVLRTAAEGDRLSLEPYGVAAEMASAPLGASPEAIAAVTAGRKRQERLAAQGVEEFARRLRGAGHELVVAGLLVNRAAWITDLLEYSLGWPEHVPVAEGLAVRDALRFGLRHHAIAVAELDEKSLADKAAQQLNISSVQIDARLKLMGAAVGKPWRKEQKLASLAAWLAVTCGADAAG